MAQIDDQSKWKRSEPKKRQIIISIDDWTNEEFQESDIRYFSNKLGEILVYYDIEITKVEVKDADEVRPT